MNKYLERLLAESSLRVTRPRRAVFNTLMMSLTPLSQTEIIKANPAIDKTSVYRTIDLFLELGVVVGVNHGWKQRYELAAPLRPHHHHLQCTMCGKLEEVHSEKLESTINIIANKNNFQLQGHVFEITGLCSTCQLV